MEATALSDDQYACVTSPAKVLRITGLPGTGKTFVLLRRAQHLAEQEAAAKSGRRVLVFCYNKTLAKYAHDLLAMNHVPSIVDTTTFHSWAYGALRDLGVDNIVLSPEGQDDVLQKALAACRGTGVRSALLGRRSKWWKEELHWIKGHLIDSWDAYRTVQRTGRGSGLQEAGRKTVWQVYTAYADYLEEHHVMEFADFAPFLLGLWAKSPQHPRVAHVLVDEAQDLGFAELCVLTQLRGDTFTAVADRKQKIYRTSFAWKDLGDDAMATFKVLKGSYRTTRPVAALAASLHLKDTSVLPSDVDYTTAELPDKEGPRPVILAVRDALHEQEVLARLVAHLQRVRGGRPIGVLARNWRLVEAAVETFKRQGVACEVIREDRGSAVTPGAKVTTFHSAKGLEFSDVVLFGLTERVFPPPTGNEVALEEGENADDFLSTERRLLYVAMTRAKHGLYLLHRPPSSRFLAELDAALYETSVPDLPDLLAPGTVPVRARSEDVLPH